MERTIKPINYINYESLGLNKEFIHQKIKTLNKHTLQIKLSDHIYKSGFKDEIILLIFQVVFVSFLYHLNFYIHKEPDF